MLPFESSKLSLFLGKFMDYFDAVTSEITFNWDFFGL